jgi:hypothetical protein
MLVETLALVVSFGRISLVRLFLAVFTVSRIWGWQCGDVAMMML